MLYHSIVYTGWRTTVISVEMIVCSGIHLSSFLPGKFMGVRVAYHCIQENVSYI